MDKPIFVLDANVFVEAKNRYYAFDIAPKFWDSLIYHANIGHIESIDRIKDELQRGKDDLAEWATGDFHSAFVSTDKEDIIENFKKIMEWVNAQEQFTEAAKSDFASGADGWLIAYAKTKDRIIVTHEVFDPKIRRKAPIPNVCKEFKIEFIDTFEMLRRLKVKFH